MQEALSEHLKSHGIKIDNLQRYGHFCKEASLEDTALCWFYKVLMIRQSA